MPMLMLKCKTCSDVFPGVYLPEGSGPDFKSSATKPASHMYSRGQVNDYAGEDYMGWS